MEDAEEVLEPDTLIIESPDLETGFTQIPNWVLKLPGLSRDAKMLYAYLLHYGWQKDHCFPGYERLQKDMVSGPATISKCLKELKDKGLISIQRRGQGKTSVYTLKARVVQNFPTGRTRTSEREEAELSNGKREEYSKKKAYSNKVKKKEPSIEDYKRGRFGHVVDM